MQEKSKRSSKLPRLQRMKSMKSDFSANTSGFRQQINRENLDPKFNELKISTN